MPSTKGEHMHQNRTTTFSNLLELMTSRRKKSLPVILTRSSGLETSYVMKYWENNPITDTQKWAVLGRSTCELGAMEEMTKIGLLIRLVQTILGCSWEALVMGPLSSSKKHKNEPMDWCS